MFFSANVPQSLGCMPEMDRLMATKNVERDTFIEEQFDRWMSQIGGEIRVHMRAAWIDESSSATRSATSLLNSREMVRREPGRDLSRWRCIPARCR